MKKIFNILIMALVSLFAFTIVYAEGTVSIDASGKAILPSDVMGKTQNPVNIPSSLMPDTPTSINDYIVPCQYGNHILKVNTKDNTVIGVSATDYTMLSSYDVQIPASEIVKDGKCILDSIHIDRQDYSSTGSFQLKYTVYSSKTNTTKEISYGENATSSDSSTTCISWDGVLSATRNNYDTLMNDIQNFKNTISNDNGFLYYYSSPTNQGEWMTKGLYSSDFSCQDLNNYALFYKQQMNSYNVSAGYRMTGLTNKIESMLDSLEKYNLCADGKEKYSSLQNELGHMNGIIQETSRAVDKMEQLKKDKKCSTDLSYLDKSITDSKKNIEKVVKKKLLVNVEFNFQKGCKLISEDFTTFLNTVLFYIKIIAIVLAVILSLLDYIKAASGSDDKPMTKANNNFITRLILIIVLFLLPVILTFVLNILHINNVTGDSIQCLDVEK